MSLRLRLKQDRGAELLASIHVFANMSSCLYTCAHTHIHICILMCLCACTCMHISTCVYAWLHTCAPAQSCRHGLRCAVTSQTALQCHKLRARVDGVLDPWPRARTSHRRARVQIPEVLDDLVRVNPEHPLVRSHVHASACTLVDTHAVTAHMRTHSHT